MATSPITELELRAARIGQRIHLLTADERDADDFGPYQLRDELGYNAAFAGMNLDLLEELIVELEEEGA
jgi:hypothetical protein